MKKLFQFILFILIFLMIIPFSLADDNDEDDFCYYEFKEYLKSISINPEQVCQQAKAYIKLNAHKKIPKCQAISHILELKGVSKRQISYSLDLLAPEVCNSSVVKFLEKNGLHRFKVNKICDNARYLVGCENLSESEALERALKRDIHTRNLDINTIKEAVRRLEE